MPLIKMSYYPGDNYWEGFQHHRFYLWISSIKILKVHLWQHPSTATHGMTQRDVFVCKPTDFLWRNRCTTGTQEWWSDRLARKTRAFLLGYDTSTQSKLLVQLRKPGGTYIFPWKNHVEGWFSKLKWHQTWMEFSIQNWQILGDKLPKKPAKLAFQSV